MSVCEVMCCKSTQDPNRTYHRFPSDTSVLNKWLKILGKKSSDLKPKSVVCSKHFRFKDYHSGGKRLLPSAVPVLRLSNIPMKEKNVIGPKRRQSEPNKQKNESKICKKKLRNSVPVTPPKKSREIKHLPKLLKTTSKSSITLNTSRNKPILKTDTIVKQEKEANGKLKAEATKPIGRRNQKLNRISLKPVTKIGKRSPLNRNKGSLKRSTLGRLCKNNIETLLKTKESGIQLVSKLKEEMKQDNTIMKGRNLPHQNINKQTPQLKKNEDVDKLKNSTQTNESLNLKSHIDISKEWKKAGKTSLLDKSKMDMRQSINRRALKKRKRLLSEDDSENDSHKKEPKSQKCRHYSGISKKELKQSQPSSCSKNLSSIEKTIVEMQNKIQMLEKKSILDEKRIEAFKNALITQRKTDIQILMEEKETELLLRMDLLYLDYDPQRICRLCLQLGNKKEDLTSLFRPRKNQALLSLIKQVTNVEIKHEEGMPTGICEECLKDIKRADWLKRRTLKSNSLIRKFVNMKKSSAQRNTSISQTTSDLKVKSDDNPCEDQMTDVFKIEDVFSLESSPVSFENITVKQEHKSDEELQQSNLLNTTYSIVKKPQKSLRCKTCSRAFINRSSLMVHFKYCSKRFQCSECNKCFLNASLFRKHKRMNYSCFCPENLRYCSDCNINFRWKWQLVFHVLRHNTQHCVLCNKTVHSDEHLQRHFNEAHASVVYCTLPVVETAIVTVRSIGHAVPVHMTSGVNPTYLHK